MSHGEPDAAYPQAIDEHDRAHGAMTRTASVHNSSVGKKKHREGRGGREGTEAKNGIVQTIVMAEVLLSSVFLHGLFRHVSSCV